MGVNRQSTTGRSNAAWAPVSVTVENVDYIIEDDVDFVAVYTAQQITLPKNPYIGRQVIVMGEHNGIGVVGGNHPLYGNVQLMGQGDAFWFVWSGRNWIPSGS